MREYIYPWFVFPFCLGSAAWALLFAQLPDALPGFTNRQPMVVFGYYVFVQVLQYAPLIAFVAVQSFKRTAEAQTTAVMSTRMNNREAVRYAFWPKFRLFCYFVCAIVFCVSFSDHGQASLLFRPSNGTDSQLMSHQMSQVYANWHGRPDVALSMVSSATLVVTGLALLSLIGSIFLFSHVWRWFFLAIAGNSLDTTAMLKTDLTSAEKTFWSLAALISGTLALGVFVFSFLTQDLLVLKAIFTVGVAACFLTAVYAGYAFVLRYKTRSFWKSTQDQSRWSYIALLLIVRIIPGTAMFYSILSFTIGFEQSSWVVRGAAWLFAHLIYNSVVVLPFLFLILMRLTQDELDFFRSLGGRLRETVRLTMVRRFSAELLVILVFCFTLIWNGDAANYAVSSFFESVNAEIVTQSINKHDNFSRSIHLVFITSVFALLAISLFMRMLVASSRTIARKGVPNEETMKAQKSMNARGQRNGSSV
ncbi:MAG: hypothetical protein QNI84_10255 [Henriciella sp.]|nr:hypothetical protein [Henriciella sp.]